MKAPNLSLYYSTLSFKSLISTVPSLVASTITVSNPAKIALAGFVPWADIGIIQIFL